MSSQLVINTRDYSDETSSTTFEGVDLTAGNFAAQNTLMDDLVTAAQAILVGHIFGDRRVAAVSEIAGVVGSPYAQREMKWLVSFTDADLGKRHSIELPAPALSFLVPSSDLIDMTATEVVDFIAAFEAYYKVNGTSDVTVNSIRLVGRNL